MNQRYMKAITLLILAVMLSGCISPDVFDQALNRPDNTEEEPTPDYEGIEVSGPQCTVDSEPCGVAEITAFSIPKLSATVENTGEGSAQIPLNEETVAGNEVLVSKCDEYLIKEFRAEISRETEVRDVKTQRTVTLKPGETLEMQWFVELRSPDTSDTSCTFDFAVELQQFLETVKQVQVRGSEGIPRAGTLEYTTPGRTPVELVVDAEEDIVQEVIGGEPTPIQAKAYIVNHGSGEITSVRYNFQDQIRLESAVQDRTCSTQDIRLSEDTQQQQRTAVVCRFMPGRIDTSQIVDITAKTTYKYRFDLSPVTITMRALEGG